MRRLDDRHDPWFWAFLGLLVLYAVMAAIFFSITQQTDSLLSVPMADSVVYLQLAQELTNNGPAAHSAFYWSPLYSLVMTLFRNAPAALVGLQMLAGLLTLGLVFLTGRRLANSRTGFLAALGLALYEPFLMEQSKLVPVTFATLLVVLGTYLVVTSSRDTIPNHRTGHDPELHDKFRSCPQLRSCPGDSGHVPATPDWWRWLLAGLSFGAGGLLMPQLLLAPVLLAVGLLVLRTGAFAARIRSCLLLAAGVACAVLPVTIRNAVVARDFVPVSSSSGFNLYLGFNPAASGLIGRPKEMAEFQYQGRSLGSVLDQEEFQRRYAEQASGRTLRPSEISGFWSRRAMAFISSQPGATARLVLDKLLLSLTNYEFANSYYPELERSMAWPLRVTFLPWAVILGLSIGGVIASGTGIVRRNSREQSVWPILVVPLTVTVSLLLFFVNSRYRLPAIPGLCLLAAWGVSRIAENLGTVHKQGQSPIFPRAQERKSDLARLCSCVPCALVCLCAVCACLIVLSAWVLRAKFDKAIRLEQAYGWRNFALNAVKLKELSLAGELLDRSARVIGSTANDDLARTYLLLGNEYVNRREWQPALRTLNQAIQYNRLAGQAYLMRGVAELALGRARDALADAEQAARLEPDLANAYALKARALLAMKRQDEARQTVSSAFRLYPQAEMLRQLATELGISE